MENGTQLSHYSTGCETNLILMGRDIQLDFIKLITLHASGEFLLLLQLTIFCQHGFDIVLLKIEKFICPCNKHNTYNQLMGL